MWDQLQSSRALLPSLPGVLYRQADVGRESRDVEELEECVGYFRRFRDGKVVLMGHSTGTCVKMKKKKNSGTKC